MGYRLSESAAEDLDRIYDHSRAEYGREQAERYADGLLRVFNFLADYPLAARLRTEIDPPVRAHPYKAHLVIYIVDQGDVLIQRIAHGREDWAEDAAI